MTNGQKIIKNNVGLLKLSQTLGGVSQAFKVMGYSRDSSYRFKELYDAGGEPALLTRDTQNRVTVTTFQVKIHTP